MSKFIGNGLYLNSSGFLASVAVAVDPPILNSLNYDLADSAGDEITISGENLANAISCTVDNSSATITNNTNTSLTFQMPIGLSPGNKDIVVETASGDSNPIPIEVFSPTSISLSLFVGGIYTGSPWTGIASAGSSSGRNLTETTNPPSIGSPINGTIYTPAEFDGINDWLSIATGSNTLFTSTAGTFIIGFNADSAAADAGASLVYNNPALILGSAVAATFSTAGWRAGVDDASHAWDASALPCSTGTWNIGILRWNATTESIAVNNTNWTTIPSGSVDVTADSTWFGRSSNDRYFDGKVAFIICSTTEISDSNIDKIIKWAQAKYRL